MVDLRRELHLHPELGLDLPRTQAAVLDALEGMDLSVTVGERLSSVVADLDGGRPGPTILLRGDMDALPMTEDTGLDFASRTGDTMHACGHDAHTAMLVGAARLLAARREELPGRVRFMFQPGEEGSGGAALMIDDGVLDGVDGAFAIHVAPNVPAGIVAWKPGPALASADELEIVVTGRGGHASTPQWATDPVPVGVRAGAGPAVDGHPDRRRVRSRGPDDRAGHRGHHPQRDPRDGPAVRNAARRVGAHPPRRSGSASGPSPTASLRPTAARPRSRSPRATPSR